MNRRGFLTWTGGLLAGTGGLLAGAKTLLGAEPRSPADEHCRSITSPVMPHGSLAGREEVYRTHAQELGAGEATCFWLPAETEVHSAELSVDVGCGLAVDPMSVEVTNDGNVDVALIDRAHFPPGGGVVRDKRDHWFPDGGYVRVRFDPEPEEPPSGDMRLVLTYTVAELGAGKVIDPRAEELRSIERALERRHPPLRFRLDADVDDERLRLASTMPRDYPIACMSRQGVSTHWDCGALPVEVVDAMAAALVQLYH